jgi:hypothetical protein
MKRLAVLLVGIVIILAACGGGGANEETKNKEKPRGGAGSHLVQAKNLSDPAVAVDDTGVVHVAWLEGLTDQAKVVSRSRAPGKQWSAPETLSTGTTSAGAPVMAPNLEGHACTFWSALTPSGVYMRCYERGDWSQRHQVDGTYLGYAPGFAPDGSATVLTQGASCCIALGDVELSAPGTAAGPALAVDSEGRIHVAWWQATAPEGQPTGMVHRVSADGGATFSDPEALDATNSFGHELVADGQGRAHWLSQDGTYRRWSSGGGWGDAVQSASDSRLGNGRIAVDRDGRAVVVFPARDGVYVAQQSDDGSFAEPRRVRGTRDTSYDAAAVTVDDDRVPQIVAVTSGDQPTLTHLVVR